MKNDNKEETVGAEASCDLRTNAFEVSLVGMTKPKIMDLNAVLKGRINSNLGLDVSLKASRDKDHSLNLTLSSNLKSIADVKASWQLDIVI